MRKVVNPKITSYRSCAESCELGISMGFLSGFFMEALSHSLIAQLIYSFFSCHGER